MTIMSDAPFSKGSIQSPGRWELNTLKENKQDLSKNPIIAKLAQELIDSKEKAKQEGYAQGFEEGQTAGHAQGFKAGLEEGQKHVQEIVNYLTDIEYNLQKLYSYSREYLAQEVLDLALDLARAVTMRSIEKQPDCIFEVVEKALEQIPILQLPAKLLLNPLDAELIEASQGRNLNDAGWKIVYDPQISRGGCRLETGSNDVDATVETRFEKMMAALGKEPQNPLDMTS
jgi:flagellar assembly protein FliH